MINDRILENAHRMQFQAIAVDILVLVYILLVVTIQLLRKLSSPKGFKGFHVVGMECLASLILFGF